MISPHATGHAITEDGAVLRVDVVAGQWVATRFTSNLAVTHRVFGTPEAVYQQIVRWSTTDRPHRRAPDTGRHRRRC